MKKIIILLVSCIIGVGLLFTGCSDNKKNQSSTNSQEEGNVLAESPLLGEWTLNKGKILIITEADRSATTVLFPDEY